MLILIIYYKYKEKNTEFSWIKY